jgi:hypothetical protein
MCETVARLLRPPLGRATAGLRHRRLSFSQASRIRDWKNPIRAWLRKRAGYYHSPNVPARMRGNPSPVAP